MTPVRQAQTSQPLPGTLANRVALRPRPQTTHLRGARAWSQSYPERLKQAVMPLSREQVVANG